MCGEMFSGRTQTRDISNAEFGLRNAELRGEDQVGDPKFAFGNC